MITIMEYTNVSRYYGVIWSKEVLIRMKIICMTLLLISVLQLTNANNQKFIVVNNTHNLPYELQGSNYKHKGRYELLPVSKKCIISKCQASTQENIDYHSYCFESECPYEHYHCLNDSGTIVHFCAKFEKCKLRSKDIAFFNKQNPKFVDVYNGPCEYGYFQPNEHHSCFEPCNKDTSIGLVQTTGNISQAYCLIEHGCNPHAKLFFELDSKYDDCTGKKQCSASQDLLPDCSCADLCPRNNVRLPENMFNCSPREEEERQSTIDVKKSTMPTLTVSGGDEARDNQADFTGFKEKLHSGTTTSGSNYVSMATQGTDWTVVIAIALGGTFVCIVAGIVMWNWKRTHRQLKPPDPVTVTSNDEKESNKTSTGTTITKIKANSVTFCQGDNYNIDIRSEPYADCATSDIGSSLSQDGVSQDDMSQDDEQNMKLLKDPETDCVHNNMQEDASLIVPKQVFTQC